MQYSANQAAEATGKNVATITRAIKSGRLSATKDEAGAWQIDGAELARVFPLRVQSLQTPDMQKDANPAQSQMQSPDNALREELAALRERVRLQEQLLTDRQEQIADLKEDRDRWRTQATGLLSDLRAAQDKIPAADPAPDPQPEPEFKPIPPRPWLWRMLKGRTHDDQG